MGLDEYPEHKLVAELENRRAASRRGECDYCGRPHGVEPSCRMAARHSGKVRQTLSLEQFHAMNVRRCEEGFGHRSNDHEGWTANDWMTAVVGELGELANLLKKRRRGEEIPDDLIRDEWADTFAYLDLLAEHLGFDPMAAVLSKFDRVSERIGWAG
jgi:NTP pyrophosphatase (non-canonical NTP hydrolase)